MKYEKIMTLSKILPLSSEHFLDLVISFLQSFQSILYHFTCSLNTFNQILPVYDFLKVNLIFQEFPEKYCKQKVLKWSRKKDLWKQYTPDIHL